MCLTVVMAIDLPAASSVVAFQSHIEGTDDYHGMQTLRSHR